MSDKDYPGKLYAFDPAIACTGWAIFNGGKLTNCGFNETDSNKASYHRISSAAWLPFTLLYPDVLAVEWPQIYGKGNGKDPNDLLTMAAVAGAVIKDYYGYSTSVKLYKPREWKGQVPKDIMNKRILGKLSQEEKTVYDRFASTVTRKSLLHNTIDAIGIGLKALGRL